MAFCQYAATQFLGSRRGALKRQFWQWPWFHFSVTLFRGSEKNGHIMGGTFIFFDGWANSKRTGSEIAQKYFSRVAFRHFPPNKTIECHSSILTFCHIHRKKYIKTCQKSDAVEYFLLSNALTRRWMKRMHLSSSSNVSLSVIQIHTTSTIKYIFR